MQIKRRDKKVIFLRIYWLKTSVPIVSYSKTRLRVGVCVRAHENTIVLITLGFTRSIRIFVQIDLDALGDLVYIGGVPDS